MLLVLMNASSSNYRMIWPWRADRRVLDDDDDDNMNRNDGR